MCLYFVDLNFRKFKSRQKNRDALQKGVRTHIYLQSYRNKYFVKEHRFDRTYTSLLAVHLALSVLICQITTKTDGGTLCMRLIIRLSIGHLRANGTSSRVDREARKD